MFKTIKVVRNGVVADMPIGMTFTGTPNGDEKAGLAFYVKKGWKPIEAPKVEPPKPVEQPKPVEAPKAAEQKVEAPKPEVK